MLNLKEEIGITTISLIVAIIVITIIAGITLYSGTNMIKKIRLEAIQTNMISIRAKAKGVAEEVNSGVWTESDENKANKRKELYKTNYEFSFQEEAPEGISQSPLYGKEYECYELTQMAFQKMGLDDIYDGNNKYLVVYDSNDYTNLDIIYESGINYNKMTYYSLAKLQEDIKSDEIEPDAEE